MITNDKKIVVTVSNDNKNLSKEYFINQIGDVFL